MTDDTERTAKGTVNLLEQRLRRIEFFLSGHDHAQESLHKAATEGKDRTVLTRLSEVEDNLAKLASNSPVVNDLLKLCTLYAKKPCFLTNKNVDKYHPDLLQPANPAEVPTSLTSSELLAIITSCATSYSTIASQLTAVKDSPIPSAESSVSLIKLHPRLAQVELRQELQAQEMAELRLRTASLLKRWYELGVLAESECWSEWEGRLNAIESRARRGEALKAQEAKADEAYRS